jgi:hypothetical protein
MIMKIKVSELSGIALDWVVAKCEYPAFENETHKDIGMHRRYSIMWDNAGPIIEREGISLYLDTNGVWQAIGWQARTLRLGVEGKTALIAAMRCYVASKLGDEIEIPEELL